MLKLIIKKFFSLAIVLMALHAYAHHKTSLALLPQEVWSGGHVAGAHLMPFKPGYMATQLGNNKANQVQPLYLLNKGRYFWCENMVWFQLSNDSVTVSSMFSEIKTGKPGNTLKDAFKFFSKSFFPPTGTIPDSLLFTVPQYNTLTELIYNQNQDDILAYAQIIIDNGFPPGVLMIDEYWQNDYGTWEFRPDKFNSPKEMIKTLHSLGFRVMLWDEISMLYEKIGLALAWHKKNK